MESQNQSATPEPEQSEQGQAAQSSGRSSTSGDQLVDELGRLGRKFVDLLDTAWNSEQRAQIEQDLRKGLAGVTGSLEEGLKDLSEKERTKEVIGKAESVADNVGEKVRTSEIANELAKGLATGLHALANEIDKLTKDLRASQSSGQSTGQSSTEGDQGQDIPITNEETEGKSDA